MRTILSRNENDCQLEQPREVVSRRLLRNLLNHRSIGVEEGAQRLCVSVVEEGAQRLSRNHP